MKRVKKNITIAMLILTIVTTLLYVAFAFATFEANPSMWGLEARAIFAFLDLSITLIWTVIVNDEF